MKEENLIEESANFFGVLYPYVRQDDITDIDYNGRELWVTYSNNVREKCNVTGLDEEFVEQFSARVSNAVSKPFNKQYPVLEGETDYLRITIVHESVAVSGRSICIRKSLPSVRLSESSIVESGYCMENVFAFLKNCVKAKMNMVYCGEPGAGKTECAKFFSQYIEPKDRVITIEDTVEWHYGKINPGNDVVELKVNSTLDYTKAIKTCLRLNPKWLMLSEVRSTEVKYLLECFSTGISGMTTLHTDDVIKIPDRMLNMAGNVNKNMENDIYSFVDIGILLKRRDVLVNGKYVTKRFIQQICYFDRVGGMNNIYKIVENGKVVIKELPLSLVKRFKDVGVENPFYVTGRKEQIESVAKRPRTYKNWKGGGTYYEAKEVV